MGKPEGQVLSNLTKTQRRGKAEAGATERDDRDEDTEFHDVLQGSGGRHVFENLYL